ncbi:MAG: hypothetical protein LBG18_00770 [Mediterranea sp.]|jgi:hypothetical protein|nr:hypothetical protein [Mediterranea sp.]
MSVVRKITVGGVIKEGINIGIKNSLSLLGSTLLWLITFWIPYLNVGTTIAINTIPIELSKGKVISPTFIFDAKYRRYMGEYFNLIGLMLMSLIPAFFFMIIPGYVIIIGWSLAIYILLDKGVSPSEALIQSNNATYGYKWTIFFVNLIMVVIFYVLLYVLLSIFVFNENIGIFLAVVLYLLLIVISQGCSAAIYKGLTKDEVTPAE